MNKRGLNTIIVSLLLILLVIASITIVWAILNILITESGEDIQKQIEFLALNFAITNLEYDDAGNVEFILQRKVGKGNVVGFLMVVEDEFGNLFPINKYENQGMKELEQIPVIILEKDHTLGGNITKISIYAIILINEKPETSQEPVAVANLDRTPDKQVECVGDSACDAQECKGICLSDNTCDYNQNKPDGLSCQSGGGECIAGDCWIFTFLGSCSDPINQPNEIYILGNDIIETSLLSAEPCLEITTNNIILDGNGYYMQSNGNGFGIYANSKSNIIIKNMNITNFRNAIRFEGSQTEDLLIENCEITYSIGYGIYFDAADSIIKDCTIGNNNNGAILMWQNGENVEVLNNTFKNNNYGLFVQTNNNLIANNIFETNTNYGIYTWENSFNVFEGNILDNNGKGIYLSDTYNNNISRGIISNSNNNNFVASSASFFLTDMYIEGYSFGSNTFLTLEDTTHGKIKFLEPISGTGSNLSDHIQIHHNLTTVKTNINPGLNSKANITFYNMPQNFINPIILKDGALCTDCYNFTSLNAPIVIFNITSWTNYNIGSTI